MLWYITYNGIECVILNYNFVLCAKSPELMGSLKYLNGLLRTIFEVITSFPSANIRTLSMNASVSVFPFIFAIFIGSFTFLMQPIFFVRRSCLLKKQRFHLFMSQNIFKILHIAYLWRTKRAKLVGGRIAAAAGTKYATSTSLSANANIISHLLSSPW